MAKQILTPAEVARELQVDVRTVYGWMRNGTLPATVLGYRTRRIMRDDLDAFVQARMVTPCS